MSQPQDPTSPGESPSLEFLLSRVALQDRKAFMQLYDATHQHLFALAVRLLSQPELAEEALQDAFVRVWHSASQYNAVLAKPMTWLINIVRNRAIDLLRSGRSTQLHTEALDDTVLDTAADTHDTPEQSFNKSLIRSKVGVCMTRLTGDQRQAVALTYFQGWQHGQIAEAMHVPLSTAKAWVRRGLQQLKACLELSGVRSAE